MDFDNPKVYGDTFISDGLVYNTCGIRIDTSRSLLDFLATMGLTGKRQASLSGGTLDLGQQGV